MFLIKTNRTNEFKFTIDHRSTFYFIIYCRSMKESVADFFGVGEENPDEQEKWLKRCMSLANNNAFGGKVC